MMKDVGKPFGTFWSSQLLQGVIFEDFEEKHRFPGPLETILRQFPAQLRKSKNERSGAKHSPRLRAAPLFAFLLAAQSVFESLQCCS